MSQAWQLQSDLRQAIENYVGDTVAEPWDSLIVVLADAIVAGGLSAARAARLDLLLQRTQGVPQPDHCPTCSCPCPEMYHG